jgi:hypothetical protein
MTEPCLDGIAAMRRLINRANITSQRRGKWPP